MTRRPLQKRVVVWSAATLLLLAWYPLGAPFVIFALAGRFPAAVPVLQVVYAPLEYFVAGDFPGSESYRRYVEGCIEWLQAVIQ